MTQDRARLARYGPTMDQPLNQMERATDNTMQDSSRRTEIPRMLPRFRKSCAETGIRRGKLSRLSTECRYVHATWRHVAAFQGDVEPKFLDSAATQRDLARNVPATGSCFGKPGGHKGRLRQCIDRTRQPKHRLRQSMDIPGGYELVSRRLGVARGTSSPSGQGRQGLGA